MKCGIACAAALVCALGAMPIAAADVPGQMDTRNRPNLCCYPHVWFVLPLKPPRMTTTIEGKDNPGSAVHRLARRIAQGPPKPVVVLPWIFDLRSVGVSALGRF